MHGLCQANTMTEEPVNQVHAGHAGQGRKRVGGAGPRDQWVQSGDWWAGEVDTARQQRGSPKARERCMWV